MKIAVGSTNPVKISAVKLAFKALLENRQFEIVGVDVASGVSEQPMSDEEAIQGAITRAKAALTRSNADYGVGLEGGLQQLGELWLTGNLAAVVRADGRMGFGISTRIAVPDEIMHQVQNGVDLTQAIHAVTGKSEIGKKEGFLGMMSKGLITRTSASREAVVAALSSVEYASH